LERGRNRPERNGDKYLISTTPEEGTAWTDYPSHIALWADGINGPGAEHHWVFYDMEEGDVARLKSGLDIFFLSEGFTIDGYADGYAAWQTGAWQLVAGSSALLDLQIIKEIILVATDPNDFLTRLKNAFGLAAGGSGGEPEGPPFDIVDGLTAYYTCEDNYDSADLGYIYDGSFASVVVTTGGRYENCWDFTADANAVVILEGSPITLFGPYTVSSWGKGLDGQGALWADNANGVHGLNLKTNSMNDHTAYIKDVIFLNVDETGAQIDGSALSLGESHQAWFSHSEWTNFTVTVEPSGDLSVATARLYINGTLRGLCTDSTLTNAYYADRIGNRTDGWYGTVPMAEKLDDIAFWSRTLPAEEVYYLYTNGPIIDKIIF